MKNKRRVQKFSIGTKLLFFIIASLIISVVVTSSLSISRYNNFIKQESQTQVYTALQNIKQQIISLEEQSIKNASVIANDSMIQSAIATKDSAKLKSELEKKNDFLKLDVITVTDQTGNALFGLNSEQNGDLKSQNGIQQALTGQTYTNIVTTGKSKLLYITYTPVKDEKGNIIGAASAGYTLERNDILDSLKERHAIDFTIFSGDTRMATTIQDGGKRVIGTQLDPKIAGIVIANKQEYFGQANILKIPYLTAYMPLLDKSNNAVGVLFAGKPLSVVENEENQILIVIVISAAVLILIVSLIIMFFISSAVSKPMLKIVDNAKRISIGDTDLDLNTKVKRIRQKKIKGKSESHNEIQLLTEAFTQIAANTKIQSEISAELANGNTSVELQARSEKDTLSLSMISMIDTLKRLTGELNRLITAARSGNYTLRGDISGYKGDYAAMIGGVNAILDETEKSLSEVEETHKVLEKKSAYQSEEVTKLVANLTKLSEGNLVCDISAAQADEDTQELYLLFSSVSQTLSKTVSTIKAYIEEISNALGEIAKGNLDVEIFSEYHGDFSKLKSSINQISESLSSLMSNINHSAEQVAAGSNQVSSGSQMLSQGTTEQAASIEELTSTISEIAVQTNKNAENAAQANKLATAAKDSAVLGNEKMQNMLQSMEVINHSSNSIAKIIKVIDDIAFQTNILALNAAVEAARAGVHGKGFAVVAEEVRNLAGKSAEAAKETTQMIENSISNVQSGAKITNETAVVLAEILQHVETAANLVADISVSSSNQADSLTQVNMSIEQVASVVQSNSATAQESAASSEELNGQAEILKSMVGQFKLKQKAVLKP